MGDPPDDAELGHRFSEAAATSDSRAPLYAALAAGIAARPALHRLLGHAPPQQRLPVLLFASVHALVLEEPTAMLAQWYPNLTERPRAPSDPALMPTFEQFVLDREPRIVESLSTRRIQTNEVGRSALFLPALTAVSDEIGPLAHLDVGASAGLNLLLGRFRYRYAPEDADAVTLGPDSPVRIETGVRGPFTLPHRLPDIATSCGLDVQPVDVTDDDEARWIEACVWPDQADRFRRLDAAIALARAHPPELLAGDALTSIRPAVERLATRAHVVVTNSWVLNYLDDDRRRAFVAELDRIGAESDLSWMLAESPALTDGLPWPDRVGRPDLTNLLLVRWRDGARRVGYLGTCHPHGYWIHSTRSDPAGRFAD